MRIELAYEQVLFAGTYDSYNSMVTVHGVVMVFIMPWTFGVWVNVWLPLNGFSMDFVFPLLNLMSVTLLACSMSLLAVMYWLSGLPAVGWTLYPPLADSSCSYSPVLDFAIMSLHLNGLSSMGSAVNLLATLFGTVYSNLSPWMLALMATAVLLCAALPILAGAITMELFDRDYNSGFYEHRLGGDVLLFQHLF